MNIHRNILLPLLHETGILVPGIINGYLAFYLMDHQISGAIWLWNKFIQGEGGILGDAMGLGKTITCIAFLSAVYKKEGTSVADSHYNRSRTCVEKDSSSIAITEVHGICGSTRVKPCLIVVPINLVGQWINSLEMWGFFEIHQFSITSQNVADFREKVRYSFIKKSFKLSYSI